MENLVPISCFTEDFLLEWKVNQKEVQEMGELGVIRGLNLTNGSRMCLGGLFDIINPVSHGSDFRLKVRNRSCDHVFNVSGHCF